MSSLFSFGRLYIFKNLSISSPDMELLIVTFYDPFYFCVVCCNFSLFVSNFIDLTLLFFLISLVNSLSILLIFSQNQLFSFFDLCYSLLHLFFIYFCSDFHDVFPSNFFLFPFSFLVALGVKLGCLFDASLVS